MNARPNQLPVFTTEEARAYRAGWDAFTAGREDCPYSDGPLREVWIAGHNDAAYRRTA